MSEIILKAVHLSLDHSAKTFMQELETNLLMCLDSLFGLAGSCVFSQGKSCDEIEFRDFQLIRYKLRMLNSLLSLTEEIYRRREHQRQAEERIKALDLLELGF